MKGITTDMLYPLCHVSHELFKNVCLSIILNLGESQSGFTKISVPWCGSGEANILLTEARVEQQTSYIRTGKQCMRHTLTKTLSLTVSPEPEEKSAVHFLNKGPTAYKLHWKRFLPIGWNLLRSILNTILDYLQHLNTAKLLNNDSMRNNTNISSLKSMLNKNSIKLFFRNFDYKQGVIFFTSSFVKLLVNLQQ